MMIEIELNMFVINELRMMVLFGNLNTMVISELIIVIMVEIFKHQHDGYQ